MEEERVRLARLKAVQRQREHEGWMRYPSGVFALEFPHEEVDETVIEVFTSKEATESRRYNRSLGRRREGTFGTLAEGMEATDCMRYANVRLEAFLAAMQEVAASTSVLFSTSYTMSPPSTDGSCRW